MASLVMLVLFIKGPSDDIKPKTVGYYKNYTECERAGRNLTGGDHSAYACITG